MNMATTETSAARQHAYTGPALPQSPEPSYAERVRTLRLSRAPSPRFRRMSRKHAGFPFGSLMPYALDAVGRPVFLISNMAMHTQNLRSDPRASLFVAQTAGDGDALGAARATLVGQAKQCPRPSSLRSSRLFTLRAMRTAVTGSTSPTSASSASSRSTSTTSAALVSWAGSLPRTMRALAGSPGAEAAGHHRPHERRPRGLHDSSGSYARAIDATEAAMTSVDRLGFYLRLKTADGMKGTRVNFLREVCTAQETRNVLIEMVKQARAAL